MLITAIRYEVTTHSAPVDGSTLPRNESSGSLKLHRPAKKEAERKDSSKPASTVRFNLASDKN